MKPHLLWLIMAAWAVPGTLHAVSQAFLDQHAGRMDALFAGLDPEHPQIAPIVSRWMEGDKTGASDALVAYFEEKSFPLESLDHPAVPADPTGEAEAAIRNSFFLNERWETIAARPDGGLDWNDRGSRDDKETAWMLNRHRFLPVLAEAYLKAGDPRYRERMNSLWQDWILSNPYPARMTFSAQWRPLEVARRVMNSWVQVFYGSDGVDPQTRLLVLSSVLDHGDSLRHHASFWGGNHLISEKIALLTLAAAWPELRQSASWRDYAIEQVSAEILGQTYPDGSYKELSNHYQRVVLVNARTFLGLLDAIEYHYNELPVYDRIEQMWNFFAGVICPDGSGPVNNASDEEQNSMLVEDIWEYFDRPDWLAIATHGAKGRLPDGSASRFFPWAGQAVIRNNWGPRADWIYFDAGPYGTAHQHVDRLHVSAYLDGRPVLRDSGRFTYKPGKWKDYFQGPQGHSILLLDGQPSEQGPRRVDSPMPVEFKETPGAVFAAAQARFTSGRYGKLLPSIAGPVPWTRAVLYDKRGFAVIVDHLVTFSKRQLEARWQFHPGISEQAAAATLRLALPADSLRQDIRSGSETAFVDGFYSPEYNQRQPAPVSSFSGSIEKPTTFIWILQRETQPPVTATLLSEPGQPVLEIRLDRNNKQIASASIRLHPKPALLQYTPM